VSYNNVQYTVKAIGNTAFAGCTGLTSITLPNTVTAIMDKAFSACYSLTSATLSNTLTTIGTYAFYNCYNLDSITLSGSVTNIGSQAFAGCSDLASFTVLAVTPPECNEYTFIGINERKCTLYVPVESIDAYKQALGWKHFTSIKKADETAGIDSVGMESLADEEVFNLNGTKMFDSLENLSAGIYIVCNGSTVRKVVIR